MLTSPVYDSIRRQFQRHLPDVCTTQCDNLSLFTLGAASSGSCHLHRLTKGIPLPGTERSRVQRFRRFLDNGRISQATHYRPLVQSALHGLKHQRVHVVLDRVKVRNDYNVLMVALAFRRRCVPLVWEVLSHGGCSDLKTQQRLLTTAREMLPEGVRITVHGDSEFRSTALFDWLRDQGHDVILGVPSRTYWYAAGDPRTPGQPIAALAGRPGQTVYREQVALTHARHGPVNLLVWWDIDAEGEDIIRAVRTNLPATRHTKRLGRRRMWIETLFRDWQSGGFGLERTRIGNTRRLERLLLVLALAYVWLVSVGRWVVKRGYRRLVDAGAPRCWKTSLFQLGKSWLERQHNALQPPPVFWYIYD
jgi:hypothetical protein